MDCSQHQLDSYLESAQRSFGLSLAGRKQEGSSQGHRELRECARSWSRPRFS